ncbi:MAG: phosphotransferase enzyme family protein, partial [Acidobacteria bacterium]|nr:phosphotransferase enzyme family protein [Acidobacteriota bacterium]
MAADVKTRLQELYRQWCGEPAEGMVPVSADGSVRRYFRIAGRRQTVIGAFNPDRKENRAFLNLSAHFRRHGLPVPEIHASDLDRHVYLQQDLGDVTLFSLVSTLGGKEGFSDRLVGLY